MYLSQIKYLGVDLSKYLKYNTNLINDKSPLNSYMVFKKNPPNINKGITIGTVSDNAASKLGAMIETNEPLNR
jgi:hypothetical protein